MKRNPFGIPGVPGEATLLSQGRAPESCWLKDNDQLVCHGLSKRVTGARACIQATDPAPPIPRFGPARVALFQVLDLQSLEQSNLLPGVVAEKPDILFAEKE